ncbi:MAG: gas vesicle protein GvpO [Methanocellales archaeon]|nr:gas vesicle protein GvpO [Methanocellales archaeon]
MATKEVLDVGKRSLAILESLLNKKAESVVSVTKEGKEWVVLTDVLERRAVPDTQDIIGRYELRLDEAGETLGYKQVMTKRRADLIVSEEMEVKPMH